MRVESHLNTLSFINLPKNTTNQQIAISSKEQASYSHLLILFLIHYSFKQNCKKNFLKNLMN